MYDIVTKVEHTCINSFADIYIIENLQREQVKNSLFTKIINFMFAK